MTPDGESRIPPRLGQALERLVVPTTRECLRRWTGLTTRTLEIGCGPGQYRLAVAGEYIGLDLTASPYRDDLPRLVDVVAHSNQLPFKTAIFDVVFFCGAFYQIVDGPSALAEAFGVLEPGGTLLIFDYSKVTLQRLSAEYAKSGAHADVRSCADWISMLDTAGFRDIRLSVTSQKLIYRLASFLAPKHLFHFGIDRMEGRIAIKARKPRCNSSNSFG